VGAHTKVNPCTPECILQCIHIVVVLFST
jgi:hypothetical protein